MKKSSLILIMSSEERSAMLLRNLKSLPVDVLRLGSFREAREVLGTDPSVDLVVTDVTLRDGNWCDVLTFLVDDAVDAITLVASSEPDENLWTEVLGRGAYGVLPEPLDSPGALRVIEGALEIARASRARPRSSLAACG